MESTPVEDDRPLRRTAYDSARFAVAAVLLVAAGLKAHQLATLPLPGTSLLDSVWVSIVVVEFELFFGLWLVSGLYPRVTWRIALGCFALFAAVSLYKALSGHASCGCFGRVQVNPWITLLLDAGIVASLMIFRPGYPPTARHQRRLQYRASLVIGMWLILTATRVLLMPSLSSPSNAEEFADLGRVYRSPTGKPIVILEPGTWVSKDLPLLPYIEDSPVSFRASETSLCERLREGEWTVVLYSSSCLECQEFLSQLKRGAVQERYDRIAILELPPYGVPEESPRLGTSVCYGRLRDAVEYFAETPLVFETDMGIVRQVNHGDVERALAH